MTRKKNMFQRGRPRKHRYKEADSNICLAGGGVIFFNSLGMFLLKEKAYSRRRKEHITDIGGKYNSDDIDIYQTISRELSEESYHEINLTREAIRFFYNEDECTKKVYINETPNSYVILFLHTSLLPAILQDKFRSNIIDFKTSREYALKCNPNVCEHHYRSLCLTQYRFDTIKKFFNQGGPDCILSTRFHKILSHNYSLFHSLKELSITLETDDE